jgi:hypothetical protein
VLDPWIIEEIRRREEEERRQRDEHERPALEIPHYVPDRPTEGHHDEPDDDTDEEPRGVVIVDFRI